MNTTIPEREAILRELIKDMVAVIRLGIDMRRAQRLYFRAAPGTKEKSEALDMSISAERAFDRAAAKAVAPDLDLGGSHVPKQ